ncbi:MAG: phosphotransferase [Muribaculaceae bacterium]|nr:phosphotransferase [Muribaculaceae bacterium]
MAGTDEMEVFPLPPSGSDRRYYRIMAAGGSYIGTYVSDPVEGECFVKLSEGLSNVGVMVPKVFAVSDDWRAYIQEDLGDSSLFSMLGSVAALEYIKETLRRLVELQKVPDNVWVSSCMSGPFSRRQTMWDLNYFKYEFLKPKGVTFDEELLEDDFECLSERLLSVSKDFMGFMMRDCQSRNVMITSRGPVFIDFQGGRKGPVLYDAVSMLWQARAGFDRRFRMEMIDFYCGIYCEGDDELKKRMLSHLPDMVLFRTLQVLGAYGFRGLVQRKAHFLKSIPGALANLKELLDEGSLDSYPELKSCCLDLVSDAYIKEKDHPDGLTVEVFSFSYKKGYPQDLSGNGGGFMFDCRALHNPGRYREYRELTGRDKPVVDFLETRGEIQPFLRNAWSLTDSAIERYLARGFTHLQIGFGCTGGQHRSVYSAERTAEHVKNLFPEASVRLIHREHPKP